MANNRSGQQRGMTSTRPPNSVGEVMKRTEPPEHTASRAAHLAGQPVLTAKALQAALKKDKPPKGLPSLRETERQALLAYVQGSYRSIAEAVRDKQIKQVRRARVQLWADAVLRGEALGRTFEGESAKRVRTAVADRLLGLCLDDGTAAKDVAMAARTLSTCYVPFEAISRGRDGAAALGTADLRDHLRQLLHDIALLEADLAAPVTVEDRAAPPSAAADSVTVIKDSAGPAGRGVRAPENPLDKLD